MEQALVFASILVGVAVSDQILSLNRLLRSDAPVSWHWAAPATALLVLLANVQIWWSVAGNRTEAVTIGEFLPTLTVLIMMALLSAASLPDLVPPGGLDLKAYYYSTRRYFWLLFALTSIFLTVVEAAHIRSLSQLLLFALDRSLDAIIIGLMIAMAYFRKDWHTALGFLILAVGPVIWLSKSLS